MQEGSPPPAVVLVHQLEVAQQDGDLSAGHDEHDHYEEKEPEDVVDLMQPKSRHDEVQLHGYCAEGQHAAQHARDERVHVPGLLRDGARDLVGTHRKRNNFTLVAEEASKEHQWHRDAEPEEQQREEGAEGNSARGSVGPEHQVQRKHDSEYHA